MNRKMRQMGLSGTTNPQVREYEIEHRKVARKAAADGMVLLKNENGFLPLAPGARLALYGAGALQTIKGGTGSGDVNVRETVSVYEGLKQAGYEIVNEAWMESYKEHYRGAREEWRDKIWIEAERLRAEGCGDPAR